MKKTTHSPPVLGFALVLAACARQPVAASPQSAVTSNVPAPGTLASVSASPAPQATDGPAGAASSKGNLIADNAGAPTEAQPTLSDEQILGVTSAANEGEIEQGRLAESKAHDLRVKALAALMVKDHTAAQNMGQTLAKKAGLSPTGSPVSTSLQGAAQNVTQSLKSASRADFDRSYVDAQVNEHQDVLDTIDQKLLPNAKNADLRAYLNEVRATVAKHLAHAKELQQALLK
jgi:putative membrane protein